MLSQSIVSYIAAEIIPAGARVKLVSGSANRVELADAADIEIGTAILFSGKSSYAAESAVGVALLTHPGTRTCLAAGAFSAGAIVKRMADGKVDDTGAGDNFGIALEASTADLDQVEVMWLPSALATPADSAVTLAKLAAETAVKIAGCTVAVANTAVTPDGVAVITLQLVDAKGAALAARGRINVWFAATAHAAPADLGTLTATTGVLLKEVTDDALALVATDATGLAVLALDTTIDGTVHAMAEVAGLVVTDSEAITGNS
jgi:hypothetical protein